jgi:hypothetical protein
LYRLLQQTHDGHFTYVPDSVGKIFNWGRPIPLVSVSEDGHSLPVPYAYPDILASSYGNITYKPSPITKIDGQPATQWLEQFSQYGSLQDRDALYNNVFYELAIVSLGTTGAGMGTFTGGGRGRWVYPGEYTTLTFKNGTTRTYTNFARVLTNFTGISTGEDLYRLKFTYPANQGPPLNVPDPLPTPKPTPTTTPTSSSAPAASPTPPSTTPAPGYPSPVIRQVNNLIGGYYLDGPGYEDVAVLNVASFVSLGSAEVAFKQTSAKFFAAAKAAGKTKLIIDVSANGGGTILQGYDLFTKLFPKAVPYGAADRFRAFDTTNVLGEIYSKISSTVPRVYSPPNATLEAYEYDIVSSVFNYRTDMTTDAKPFPNWPAKYGPHPSKGDKFSSLFRWNLSDVLTPYNSGGIYVSGYDPTEPTPEQPFERDNIIVMTDGYCASTCTIFSQLMRQVAGVKYVIMGGRSRPGIAQAVGGVKGTNNFEWENIQYTVEAVYTYSSPQDAAQYHKNTALARYDSNIPFYRIAYSGASSINFRDGIRKGDQAQVPLQFVYEPADCRIYWTKEMTVDISAAWKSVADSAWGGKNKCVAGSARYGGYGNRRSILNGDMETLYDVSSGLQKRDVAIEEYPLDLYTDPRAKGANGMIIP